MGMSNDRTLALGFILIPFGFLVLLLGVWMKVPAFVLVGTCITSAASYGFTYLASLAEVSLRASSDRAQRRACLSTPIWASLFPRSRAAHWQIRLDFSLRC